MRPQLVLSVVRNENQYQWWWRWFYPSVDHFWDAGSRWSNWSALLPRDSGRWCLTNISHPWDTGPWSQVDLETQDCDISLSGSLSVSSDIEVSCLGLDSTTFVYPGRTASRIQGRIDTIATATAAERPDAILIHAGDVEVCDSRTSAHTISYSLKELVQTRKSKFVDTRIVLSGLPYVHGNITLNNKIDQVNLASAHLCWDTANCVFIGTTSSGQDQFHT